MTDACNCSNSLLNTGAPGCEPIMDVARKLIIVPLYADDGTRNSIDLATATLDSDFFEALRDQADPSKRWYPLPLLDNVEDTKDDPVTEDFSGGTRQVQIREGARNFMAQMVGASPAYLGQIKDQCGRIGVYVIDEKGNLIGSIGSDGTTLYPIRVDHNTWYARLIKTAYDATQKVQLDFQFFRGEKDENLRMVQLTDMDNYDLLSLNGLLDVFGRDLDDSSDTQVKVKLFTRFGSVASNGDLSVPVESLGTDDIIVDNAGTEVTPSTVTEDPDGTYVIEFAAQTTGDEVKLKMDKAGFSADGFVKDVAGNDLVFTL